VSSLTILRAVFSLLLFCPPASAVSEPASPAAALRVAAVALPELPASAEAGDSVLDGLVALQAADFP
jgi:hypothetical protein